METGHKLSEEQYNELKSLSSEEVVDSFLFTLNNRFGGGEVLAYEYILDIFQKRLYNEGQVGWLTTYIDTIRMLHLVGESPLIILLMKDYSELTTLHDALSKKVTIDDALAPLYVSAIKPFVKLSQTILVNKCKVRFELISTIDELKYEGSFMEHCIATYANFITSGNYVAFRVFDENTNGRFTLGLHRNVGEFGLLFDQLKGKRNSPASVEACVATQEFCKKNRILILADHNEDLYPIRRFRV